MRITIDDGIGLDCEVEIFDYTPYEPATYSQPAQYEDIDFIVTKVFLCGKEIEVDHRYFEHKCRNLILIITV